VIGRPEPAANDRPLKFSAGYDNKTGRQISRVLHFSVLPS